MPIADTGAVNGRSVIADGTTGTAARYLRRPRCPHTSGNMQGIDIRLPSSSRLWNASTTVTSRATLSCGSAFKRSKGKVRPWLLRAPGRSRPFTARYIWNRRECVKDPDNPTRRTPRLRPSEEWKTAERPDLRIVSDEQAVRARMASPRRRSGQRGRSAPMRTLFGGLLRCAVCGGAMVAVQSRYYGCAAHKDRGLAVCRGTFASRRETDTLLVAELQKHVLAPDAIAKIEQRVRALLGTLHDQARDAAAARTARANELTAEIARLVDAIAQTGLSSALRKRLTAAEEELARLDSASRRSPSPPGLHDANAIRTRIKAMAADLKQALATDVSTARDVLSKKLGDIVVAERDDGIYAQMDIGPVLLRAAGADVFKTGCGGRI